MSERWLLTLKPSFLAEWLALPPKDSHLVHEKIALLTEDPTPDAKLKKQLKGLGGALHRLRAGDYRVFYTFAHPHVSVLALRRRKEDTYDDAPDAEFLGGLDAEMPAAPAVPDSAAWLAPPKVSARPLPERLTKELLERLKVPARYHARLAAVETQEALLACEGVPDDVLLTIDQSLFERPIAEVAHEKDLVARSPDDLLRFKEGALEAFLLKLDGEQERFVSWGLHAKGPTLLKGSAGTGKSTVALYRVRAMLDALRAGGVRDPRVLFTTYTSALAAWSRQLLQSLLGADAARVDVRHVDQLTSEVLRAAGESPTMVSGKDLKRVLAEAVSSTTFAGNKLVEKAQRAVIERLSSDWLLDEIGSVIEARRMKTVYDYIAAARPGRGVPLNATQRRAVWAVRERLVALLTKKGVMTWSQARARAAALVEEGTVPLRYDAVLVDEAQDLEVSTLQLVAQAASAPNRIFLTADANQTIYGTAFRWSDIDERLKFTGRVGVLRANHRSTREVGEAAMSYLANGTLDAEGAPEYLHEGPVPVVRSVGSFDDEAQLLARFIPAAARSLRLGVGSTAVLVPTEKAGKRIARALQDAGVAASFMPGKELDLAKPGAKVITLKSSKGLEFPIVAVAGFLDAPHPPLPDDADAEERAETLARERRTLYVAMTRAMRALLVVLPAGSDSPLFTGFDPALWNTGGAA